MTESHQELPAQVDDSRGSEHDQESELFLDEAEDSDDTQSELEDDEIITLSEHTLVDIPSKEISKSFWTAPTEDTVDWDDDEL